MDNSVVERISPCEKAHAIKSVSFAVELNKPLGADAFLEISSLHPKLKDRLPRKIESTAITVDLDVSRGMRSRTSSPELNGLVFDRLKPDGTPEWKLDVGAPHVAVFCAKYTRWADVWASAREIFAVVLPIILKFRYIKAVGLQYIDEFTWAGDRAEFRSGYLFREGTEYLPNNVFALNGLWHNHHGFFSNPTGSPQHRLLTNLNVSVSDREDARVISKSAVHRALLDDLMTDVDHPLGEGGNEGPIDALLDEMHRLNKSALCGLLVYPILRRINLKCGAA